MDQKKLHEVDIAGIPLKLLSQNDEATVRQLVQYVDQKIKEALPLTKTGSIQNAALLAALHIAEELHRIKRDSYAELGRLAEQTQNIVNNIDIASDSPSSLNN